MRKVLGYVSGKPREIYVAKVEGVELEITTAIAFLQMARKAKEDGIVLKPTSGWRSMEKQTALWEERQDPKIRARKGIAAKPGWSRHQSGMAIDIKTGLSIARFKTGETTAIYRWLKKNAPKFGFAHTVPNEPWHLSRVFTPERPDIKEEIT